MQFDDTQRLMRFTEEEQELLECNQVESIDLLPNIYLAAYDRRELNLASVRAATKSGENYRQLRLRLMKECVILSPVIIDCRKVGKRLMPEIFDTGNN